jgi:predicted NBD/HSP70 family sugar kinase
VEAHDWNGEILPEERKRTGFRILEYLQHHHRKTAREIADALRVDTTNVHRWVELKASKGRPGKSLRPVLEATGSPRRYSLRPDAGMVLSVDLGAQHWRVACAGVGPDSYRDLKPIGETVSFESPEEAIKLVGQAAKSLLADVSPEDIAAVVIGVPFTPDDQDRPRRGGEWNSPLLPRDLYRRLGWKSTTTPHIVESNTSLGAVAEHAALCDPGRHKPELRQGRLTITYVKWGTNLRAALVIDGRLRRSDGLAASFVHEEVHESDSDFDNIAECNVCMRPCAASRAGLQQLTERIRKVLVQHSLSEELVVVGAESIAPRLVELAKKHEAVGEILSAAAFAVGHCLGQSANVIAGQNVVVGGGFKDDDAEWIKKHIEAGYKAAATPAIFENVKLVTGNHTGSAALTGGLILGAERYAVPYLWWKSQHGKPRDSK